jgi:uncharacterized protein YjbJ (UPF0337 family)
MSNKNKAKNVAQVSKGRIEESVGRNTGDHKLEAHGKVDQVKGNIKQAGEEVKDAFKE